MGKFIYVFSEDAKDRLVASGFDLIKSDSIASIYVFVNDEQKVRLDFESGKPVLGDISYIESNVLTF